MESGWMDKFWNLVSATHIGWMWFLLIAAWGGTANYISRLKRQGAPFSLMELIGEWTVSAFAGVITAYVCMEMNFSFYATAALVGVAGHMGGRGIALMELFIENELQRRFGGKK